MFVWIVFLFIQLLFYFFYYWRHFVLFRSFNVFVKILFVKKKSCLRKHLDEKILLPWINRFSWDLPIIPWIWLQSQKRQILVQLCYFCCFTFSWSINVYTLYIVFFLKDMCIKKSWQIVNNKNIWTIISANNSNWVKKQKCSCIPHLYTCINSCLQDTTTAETTFKK